MSTATKRTRRRKDAKREAVKDVPPQVVTCALADNTYTGIIREGPLGMQFLDCPDAKYVWNSGVVYQGPLVQSRIEGSGQFSWPDGSSYQGELKDGKRHGQGIYNASEGPGRYEGEWANGKREGIGKLFYSADGSAYYHGGWKDGKKHGHGRQVWPSGNIYEGDWAYGKMAGFGTMTWSTSAGSEQYVGQWVANQPDGQGTHTWLTVDLTKELVSPASPEHTITNNNTTTTPTTREPFVPKPSPLNHQQQMHNRYEGQWVQGKRHGKGIFYYANGAKYDGEWENHLKQGKGRHTFEDGSVYDGNFEADRMVDYKKPPAPEGPEIIARCTDISDLRPLLLPSDRAGFQATGGAGYQEKHEIYREVYNMVLRHLGELRELYGKYRAMVCRAGSDPLTLQSYQFWLLARDAGLLPPSLPLAQLLRSAFYGPRHHSEVAPGDVSTIEPLKAGEIIAQRAPSRESRGRDPSPGHVSIAPLETDPGTDIEGDLSCLGSEYSDASSPRNGLQKTVETVAGGSPGISRPTSAQVNPEDRPASRASQMANRRSRRSSANSRRNSRLVTLGEGFVRTSSCVVSTHADKRLLLFRHFIEALVRLAPARFPNERGLEAQVHRLFKHCLLPAVSPLFTPSSEPLFSFYADHSVQLTLEAFHKELWGIFKQPQPQHHREAPFYQRARRQLHVNARSETTIRIKDALRLLDACGLLRPNCPAAAAPRSPSTSATSFSGLTGVSVFGNSAKQEIDDGQVSADRPSSGGSQGAAEKDITVGFLQSAAKLGGISGLGNLGGLCHGLDHAGHETDDHPLDGNKDPKKKRQSSREVVKTQEEIDCDEFLSCDFSQDILQALGLLAETVSPCAIADLRWELHRPLPGDFVNMDKGEGSSAAGESSTAGTAANAVLPLWAPPNEQVSVLDYLESELIYAEFQRMLVEIVARGTHHRPAFCDRLSLGKRLELFLRLILLPTLVQKYEPPPEEEEEEEHEAAPQSHDSKEAGSVHGSHEVDDLEAAVLGAIDELHAEGVEKGPAKGEAEAGEAAAETAAGTEEKEEAAEDKGGQEATAEAAVAQPPVLWTGFEGPNLPIWVGIIPSSSSAAVSASPTTMGPNCTNCSATAPLPQAAMGPTGTATSTVPGGGATSVAAASCVAGAVNSAATGAAATAAGASPRVSGSPMAATLSRAMATAATAFEVVMQEVEESERLGGCSTSLARSSRGNARLWPPGYEVEVLQW